MCSRSQLDRLLAGGGAVTELLVARRAQTTSERRILQTLAGSFIVIALLILASLGLGLGKGTVPGQYLQTFANLGSLLPSALLAYYIYRYRYLELIIKESLIVAPLRRSCSRFISTVSGALAIGRTPGMGFVRESWKLLILALTLLAALCVVGWREFSIAVPAGDRPIEMSSLISATPDSIVNCPIC
jgi:hypothetical protein